MTSTISPAPSAVPSAPTNAERGQRTIAPTGTLFHPKSGAGIVTKDFYTRVSLTAKRINFAVGADRRQAQRLDRELRARLIAGEPVPAVKAWVAEQLGHAVPPPLVPVVVATDPNGEPWATIGDLLKVRATYKFTAKVETTRQYEFCFLNLVELALQYRTDPKKSPPNRSGRRVSVEDYQHVLALPSSILTDELVDEFQQARITHAEREGRDETAARITANTELRQARAVLVPRALTAFKRARLRVPDFSPFVKAPILEKAKRTVVAPHEDVIRNLHSAWRAAHADRQLFIVLALALHAGLRRNEILHAHLRWLQRTTGPSLVLRTGSGFEAKNGEERTVPIPEWLYSALKASGASYFVDSDEMTRRATLDRAVIWLREQGFANTGKPLHALRGLYAGYLLTRFPFLIVRQRLGHQDIRTTLDYYANNPFAEEIARLWEEVPTAPSGTS